MAAVRDGRSMGASCRCRRMRLRATTTDSRVTAGTPLPASHTTSPNTVRKCPPHNNGPSITATTYIYLAWPVSPARARRHRCSAQACRRAPGAASAERRTPRHEWRQRGGGGGRLEKGREKGRRLATREGGYRGRRVETRGGGRERGGDWRQGRGGGARGGDRGWRRVSRPQATLLPVAAQVQSNAATRVATRGANQAEGRGGEETEVGDEFLGRERRGCRQPQRHLA